MKQLLFLLLFPCFAIAQYQGNGNQKITLGEQTTADGLVWRGRLADTANLLTNKLDTSVYIVLDTGTRAMWYYRASTTPKWTRLVDSLNNLQGQLSLTLKVTGTLPVANGGTGKSSLTANKILVGSGTDTIKSPTNLHWDNTNSRLGINNNSPSGSLDVSGNIFLRGYTDIGSSSNIQNNYLRVIDGSVRFKLQSLNGQSIAYMGTETNHSVTFISNNEPVFYITNSGRIGVGSQFPTALLEIKAGTAAQYGAPLKFTAGTNLTTPETGAMEFNGTNLFFSPSTTRHTVNHGLTGSATLDFPSTTTLLSADLTISVTGAADGDVVSLGVPNAAVNANTCYTAWVSAANTVTVRFNNYSSGTVNPASGTFKVFVTK